MNQILLLFLIILFALVICPMLSLGMREGMDSQTETQPVTYSGPNGGTATVTTYADETIIQVSPAGSQPGSNQVDVYYIDTTNTDPTKVVYICSTNGDKAVITTDQTTGYKTVTVYHTDGTTDKYTYNPTTGTTTGTTTTTTSTYYGPNCATATVTDTTVTINWADGSQSSADIYTISKTTTTTSSDPYKITYYGGKYATVYVVQYNNGDKGIEVIVNGKTIVFYMNQGYYDTSMCSSTNNNQYPPPPPPTTSTSTYYGPNGGQVNTVTGPYGNTVASYDSSSYYNSTANSAGIPKSQIPPGEEDLYILKTQIVPPVCPKCPTPVVNKYSNSNGSSSNKCQPCPACARCPEPSFECKKVPNYKTINTDMLPMPYVNDFSAF